MDEDLQEKLDEISSEIENVKSDIATQEDIEEMKTRLYKLEKAIQHMKDEIIGWLENNR
jgi:tetrahydromethanopterin S-methyltransferase subunit G